MSRLVDLTCLLAVVLGIVLFLYGANYYDNLVGWAGVYLFVGGIFARIIIFAYKKSAKKLPAQNP